MIYHTLVNSSKSTKLKVKSGVHNLISVKN